MSKTTHLPKKKDNDQTVTISVLRGKLGATCLCIGDDELSYRLAGTKLWGGGEVAYEYSVSAKELRQEITSLLRRSRSREKRK